MTSEQKEALERDREVLSTLAKELGLLRIEIVDESLRTHQWSASARARIEHTLGMIEDAIKRIRSRIEKDPP